MSIENYVRSNRCSSFTDYLKRGAEFFSPKRLYEKATLGLTASLFAAGSFALPCALLAGYTVWKKADSFTHYSPEKQESELIYVLDQLNTKKGTRSPSALVLMGWRDADNVLINVDSRFLILELAKTHRVYIERVSNSQQIPQKIQQSSLIQPLNEIVFLMHGTNDIAFLGRPGSANANYHFAEIHEEDFRPIPTHTNFILFNCRSGVNFAPTINRVLSKRVVAPLENCNPSQTHPYICRNHGQLELVSYDENQNQHMKIFDAGQIKDPCFRGKIPTLGRYEYIFTEAMKGDGYAFAKLGFFFHNNASSILKTLTSKRALSHIALYLESAAAQATKHYKFKFDLYSKIKNQNQRIIAYCYLVGAYLNNREGCYLLADLFERGEIVEQSLEHALSLYKKAAGLGLIEAQKKLTSFEEHGIGALS